MNIQSSLAKELQDKEYRDAFVEAEIATALPFQVRALRKRRGWTQPELAKLVGMTQSRISELETAGLRRMNINTLLRLASAFDVAVQISFVSFSDLVDASDAFNPEKFEVLPFQLEVERLRDESKTKPSSALGAALSSPEQRAIVSPISVDWLYLDSLRHSPLYGSNAELSSPANQRSQEEPNGNHLRYAR